MLPLYLLTNAKGQQMRIELKNGDIVEGELTNVDNWMNLTLANVNEYKGSENNTNLPQVKVVKSKEIYVRGVYIKYITLQDDIIEKVKQQINNNNNNNNNRKFNNRNHQNNYGYRRNNTGGNYNNGNNNNNNNRRNYNNRRYYNNQNQNQNQSQGQSQGQKNQQFE